MEGVGGIGGKVGWDEVRWVGRGGVGGGKNPCLGQPMSIHDAHTVANSTLVGNRARGSKTQVPTTKLASSISAMV